MALELLAGPFTLSSTLGDSVRIQSAGRITGYADGVGLITTVLVYDGATLNAFGTATIKFDGQTFLRGADLSGASRFFGADQVTKGLLYQASDIRPYSPAINTLGDPIGVAVPHIYKMVRLREGTGERFIRTNTTSGNIETSPDAAGATTGWTIEYDPNVSLGSNPGLTLCKDGTLIVGCSNGTILFYDTVAKTRKKDDRAISVTTGLIGTWYSEKHDIFISLHDYGSNVWKVNVWASSVLPTTLSTPVALSGPSKGRVSQMRTRLTGSASDPCVGELIDWTLTGDGALSAAQSETDIDGYAYIDYIAPIDTVPSFDLTAEARF